MSIQSALQAGVAGLGSQSRKFATISDNIANSETIGYKRTDANFISQVIDSGSKSTYSAGGVTTSIQRDISRAGTIRGSSSGTDIAINGPGFLLVKGGLPENQDSEQQLLTRVGQAEIDQDGYFRLTNGYYLQGVPLDADGNALSNVAQSIVLQQTSSAPTPTDTITFRTNLPSEEAVVPYGTALSSDVTYVDELGTDQIFRFTWTPGGSAATDNTWRLQVFDMLAPGVPVYDQDIAFDTTGINAGRPSSIPLASAANEITLTNANGMAIQAGLTLSQFDYGYNPYFVNDGVPVSDFAGIEVGEDGTVFTVFENGFRSPQYRLMMGDVVNPDGLRPVEANAYAVSIDSGDLIPRFPGEGSVGTLQSFAVEGSNVDIAEELTQMIVTQRAYSANASIITTSDEMLEEIVRLKR